MTTPQSTSNAEKTTTSINEPTTELSPTTAMSTTTRDSTTSEQTTTTEELTTTTTELSPTTAMSTTTRDSTTSEQTTTTEELTTTTDESTTTFSSTYSTEISSESTSESDNNFNLKYSKIESYLYDLKNDEPEPVEYDFIKPESINLDSFVICVGECKFEGFWMMIAFVSLCGWCLLMTGLSLLCSKQGRQVIAWSSTVLCLGLIGGLIYIGVTEKVNWTISGGYLGGTAAIMIVVLFIGCRPPKTKRVKEYDNEMYWQELSQRDRKSRKVSRSSRSYNMYSTE